MSGSRKRSYVPPQKSHKSDNGTYNSTKNNSSVQFHSKKIEKTIECLLITAEDGTPLILEPIATTHEGYTLYVGRAPEPGEEVDTPLAQGPVIGKLGVTEGLHGV